MDNYSEITDILRDIEVAVKRNNVFISGSAEDYADWGRDKAEELAAKISESLVKNKNIIIPVGSTGFMAKKIFDEVRAHMDDYKYLENYMDVLEKENDVDKLVAAIIDIVKKQRIA